MTIDKIIVTIFSGAGIMFTYWFFLMKKDKEVAAVSGSIDIIVDGGYSPSTISVPIGKTTNINFLRRDSSSCLEEVVLPEFKLRKYLPLDKKVTVSITPERTGEYEIVCGMNMFYGKIIVK